MATRIGYITLLVDDQEEALGFYTERMGWEKREDDASLPGARWLTVAPPGQEEVAFTLRLISEGETERVGRQVGGEFLCTLVTDNLLEVHDALDSRGVTFVRPPQQRPFGLIATLADLYGNLIDLWEPRRG